MTLGMRAGQNENRNFANWDNPTLTLYCMKPFPAIKNMPFNTHDFERKQGRKSEI